MKGVAYSRETITASGGVAPYTFAVTAGALPGWPDAGPTTGALSGTPTATGTFTFTVTATDANSFTGTQAVHDRGDGRAAGLDRGGAEPGDAEGGAGAAVHGDGDLCR